MFASNAFEQFIVILLYNIADYKILITNTIVVSILIFLFTVITNYLLYKKTNKRYTKTYINIFKLVYLFIFDICGTYLPKKALIYFPFFLFLFLFICYSNVIGITPFSYTITSHLSITFSLAFTVWYANTIIGIQTHGLRYFALFVPSGIPFRLVPLLVLIEVISYVFRSISLALRLFANIVAGHILLDTVAIFLHSMLSMNTITSVTVLAAIIPFIFCIVLLLFEFVVALLQGYIFIILACIYLKDVYSIYNH